ncbi:hypothetical protein ALNOE001_00100 [Candidatus Methanobinarius endosymbioticus]|uniref:Right handed beta helix domain-containing protein n=1 Tax=Candidatus Methanobinarius endosymbioticus TaxID=2006182 RepID=A0A366MFY5_9EURY|nr:hypothetical protein ALNOE001_00100 [Candidatus Methanobinarius endosymbioticus]
MLINKGNILIFLIILSFFVLFSLSVVSAGTHNLDNTTTHAAINIVISSDSSSDVIINLASGDYNGLTGTVLINRANVTIVGETRDGVKITGPATGTLNLFTIRASNVKIINLTISSYTTAINSDRGNLTITNNNITSRGTTSVIQIQNNNAANNLKRMSIENNTIVAPTLNTNNVGAIHIYPSNANGVSDSIVGNNITATNGSNSIGVFLRTPGNTNIILDDNNLDASRDIILLFNGSASTLSKDTNITFTNNNITGTNDQAVFMNGYNSSYVNINFTKNNIKRMHVNGVGITAEGSTNINIYFDENNITSLKNDAVYFGVYIRTKILI